MFRKLLDKFFPKKVPDTHLPFTGVSFYQERTVGEKSLYEMDVRKLDVANVVSDIPMVMFTNRLGSENPSSSDLLLPRVLEATCEMQSIEDFNIVTYADIGGHVGTFGASNLEGQIRFSGHQSIFQYNPTENAQTVVYEISSGLLQKASHILTKVELPVMDCRVVELKTVNCKLPKGIIVIVQNMQGGVIPCLYEVTETGINFYFEKLALYTAQKATIRIINPYIRATHTVSSEYVGTGFKYITI